MTEEKESILKRIQKLLRMSEENGASQNEAMMAAQKVQELLQEHNLSLSDVDKNDGVVEPIGSEDFEIDRDKWKSWISASTARLYFCTTYTHKKLDKETYQWSKVRAFVGRESNRKIAKSMCDYFIKAVERMAEDHVKKIPGSKSEINRIKFNFMQGCALELSARIEEKYNNINGPDYYGGIDNPNNLPKLFRDENENNRNWLVKQGIKLRSTNSSIRVKDRLAFNNGKESGKNIGIDTQVNANSRRYLSA